MNETPVVIGTLIALLATGIAAETPKVARAAAPTRGASFQGLGDLSGGTFESLGLRVSADGSLLVGNGTTASAKQAFRWTQREGMVSLGNLPDGWNLQDVRLGGESNSVALA